MYPPLALSSIMACPDWSIRSAMCLTTVPGCMFLSIVVADFVSVSHLISLSNVLLAIP